jgi:hypothetical protein
MTTLRQSIACPPEGLRAVVVKADNAAWLGG